MRQSRALTQPNVCTPASALAHARNQRPFWSSFGTEPKSCLSDSMTRDCLYSVCMNACLGGSHIPPPRSIRSSQGDVRFSQKRRTVDGYTRWQNVTTFLDSILYRVVTCKLQPPRLLFPLPFQQHRQGPTLLHRGGEKMQQKKSCNCFW